MLDVAPNGKVTAVLNTLEEALTAKDIDKALNLFADDCYWRDLISFTWNIKTMEGKDQIRDMLESQLASAQPHNWSVAEGEVATDEDGLLTSWITFETAVARGYGMIRIKDDKIWTLLTASVELKGHEEPLGFERPMGAKHGFGKHRKSWAEEREQELSELGYKTQPEVVIIGGGQGGIALGARLRQLGVPTIIIEKNERAGDSWRKRYKSLCLHDPVWYDHLPYLPFPPNWPIFAPKDKLGDWLEMYAKVMELNYWTNTRHSLPATMKRAVNGRLWWIVVENRSHSIHVIWCWLPACRAKPMCRNSKALRGSRGISITHPDTPARIRSQARKSWLSAPTIRPTISARHCGRTMWM